MDVRDYTEKYLQQYRKGPGWFEQVMVRSRRARVLETLDRYPHRRVLEVGCGLEPLFTYWGGFEQFTVVEPSPEFVAHAERLAAGRPDVRIVQGFLEEQAEAVRAPYDVVVVSSLVHEVPDPVRLLQAVRGLCGPETVAHFNVPNMRSFHRLLALEMGLITDVFEPSEMEKKFQRHTRYDRERFTRLLQEQGFELLRFGTYFVKPFSHAQMEKLIDQGIVDERALAGLERMVEHMPDLGAEMFAEVRRAG